MTEMTTVLDEWIAWAQRQGIAHPVAKIDPLGIPHRPTALPMGRQGIYGFRWRGTWLKIGKAGPNTRARWLSQHYGAFRAPSTLASSLFRYGHLATNEDPLLPGLKAELRRTERGDLGEWMKANTERINVVIGTETGSVGLAELEAIAHRLLAPVFEGKWKFGGAAV